MGRVGRAILTAPAGCHGGLAQTLGVSESDYFVGVRADTRAELDDAVERSGREPILTGELEILCGL